MSSLKNTQAEELKTDTPVAETPTFGHQGDDRMIEVVESFDDMDLKDQLLRGIYAYGWETPSYIQMRAVRPVTSGRDTIAQAQSGKGKTGAFTVGALQILDSETPETQIVILSPTRDLSRQTYNVICALSQYMDGARVHLCIGGTSVRADVQAIRRGVHVVVGTPGRILDMQCRGVLDVSSLKCLIMDEADEMLSRGFKEAVYEIFSHLPQEVQVCLFSATMPPDVLEVTEKFMRSPARILVKKEELTLDGIRQFYVNVEQEKWKFECLKDLYQCISIQQCIIYCGSKKRAEELTAAMLAEDFVVSLIHGGLDWDERQRVMDEFRQGTSRVLISTDLTARGIDVFGVNLVINYDLPHNRENYIHRIGRSGRFGRKGNSINFVTRRTIPDMLELERFYSTSIEELPGDGLDELFG